MNGAPAGVRRDCATWLLFESKSNTTRQASLRECFDELYHRFQTFSDISMGCPSLACPLLLYVIICVFSQSNSLVVWA